VLVKGAFEVQFGSVKTNKAAGLLQRAMMPWRCRGFFASLRVAYCFAEGAILLEFVSALMPRT